MKKPTLFKTCGMAVIFSAAVLAQDAAPQTSQIQKLEAELEKATTTQDIIDASDEIYDYYEKELKKSYAMALKSAQAMGDEHVNALKASQTAWNAYMQSCMAALTPLPDRRGTSTPYIENQLGTQLIKDRLNILTLYYIDVETDIAKDQPALAAEVKEEDKAVDDAVDK